MKQEGEARRIKEKDGEGNAGDEEKGLGDEEEKEGARKRKG